MQWRPEFSFQGAAGLPPRPRGSAMAARDGEEEFRWLQASRQGSPEYGSGGSGTPSPQMWARHEEEQLHHRPYAASAGSSPSRAQAIAGYRREMLDLIRGLPEAAYELSLRDIVERPSSPPAARPLPLPAPPSNASPARVKGQPVGAKKDAAVADEATKQQGKKQGRKQRTARKQWNRSMERSVSLDTGLLIKFFLPLSIGGGKKKVSPKPDAAQKKEKKKQGKKEEAAPEEWWTKCEFSEAGTSSRTSSTGSSNSSSSTGSIRSGGSNPRAPSRTRSRKRTGCYAFFRANKSKNGVGHD